MTRGPSRRVTDRYAADPRSGAPTLRPARRTNQPLFSRPRPDCPCSPRPAPRPRRARRSNAGPDARAPTRGLSAGMRGRDCPLPRDADAARGRLEARVALAGASAGRWRGRRGRQGRQGPVGEALLGAGMSAEEEASESGGAGHGCNGRQGRGRGARRGRERAAPAETASGARGQRAEWRAKSVRQCGLRAPKGALGRGLTGKRTGWRRRAKILKNGSVEGARGAAVRDPEALQTRGVGGPAVKGRAGGVRRARQRAGPGRGPW